MQSSPPEFYDILRSGIPSSTFICHWAGHLRSGKLTWNLNITQLDPIERKSSSKPPFLGSIVSWVIRCVQPCVPHNDLKPCWRCRTCSTGSSRENTGLSRKITISCCDIDFNKYIETKNQRDHGNLRVPSPNTTPQEIQRYKGMFKGQSWLIIPTMYL